MEKEDNLWVLHELGELSESVIEDITLMQNYIEGLKDAKEHTDIATILTQIRYQIFGIKHYFNSRHDKVYDELPD